MAGYVAKNTTKQKLRHTGAVTVFVMFLTAPIFLFNGPL